MRMDKKQIMDVLPHREPFLFLDEIAEIEPERRAVGHWLTTGREAFYKGHFPGNPVLPGALIVEAMAQTGAVVVLSIPRFKGMTGYFAGMDRVRFRKKVYPGDLLVLEVGIERVFNNIGYGEGTAYVEGEVVATGKLTFAVG